MTLLVQTPFLTQSFVFTSITPPAHPPEEQASSTLSSNDFRKLVHAKSLFITNLSKINFLYILHFVILII